VLEIAEFTPIDESWRKAYLAVGNFDGVHRGHQALVARLRERAVQAGRPALVLTFDPRPVEILRPAQAPPPLSWIERRIELLLRAGADEVGVFRTGPWLLNLTAREFFDRVIRSQFDAQGMVEGPTFGFGRDRGGDATLLARWCQEAGMSFEVVPPVEVDGLLVSSTQIREALAQGRVEQAARLLGQPHRIRGTVVPGARRGATLGFPTANLTGIAQVLPRHGVYAGHAYLPDGQTRPAAIHIGPNATFDATEPTVEAHLLDFSGNLYGLPLQLDFLRALRPTRRFDSVPELLAQISADVAQVRQLL
jgi:riboflavin kinase/FMN adenylyltransferase